jgi:hypothetical protein
MSSIISALSDLATSLVELVWSFFTTAGHLVQNTASFAATFATEIVELVINFFKGLVDLAGGIVSFMVGRSTEDSLTGCTRCTRCTDESSRQRPHARRFGRSVPRLPSVPAKPGPRRAGW